MIVPSLNQSQARSRRAGPWVGAGLRQLRSQTQTFKGLSQLGRDSTTRSTDHLHLSVLIRSCHFDHTGMLEGSLTKLDTRIWCFLYNSILVYKCLEPRLRVANDQLPPPKNKTMQNRYAV